MQDLSATLAFAEQAILQAGEIALRYFRRPLQVDNKLAAGAFDPVTRADREVEACLRASLRERFPSDSVLGEEAGRHDGESQRTWVIDPIDGTKAFISGFPTWGVLLGLVEGDRVLAGLMHQPFTGELFSGSANGSTLLRQGQRSRLQTNPAVELPEAILYCTHESMFAGQDHLDAFRRVAAKVRLQRFGGDCYAYCMLAQGLIDLVIEDTLQPYDIIPLIPIIEGAGGVVTSVTGGPAVAGGFVVAAANARLHRQAMDLLGQ